MKSEHSHERITIGKILKPRGIRGEVKVLPLTDIPDRFEQLESVLIEISPLDVHSVVIEQVKHYKGCVYLHFQDFHSINEIQGFIGKALQVERSQTPELPEGVYYRFEIIGADVYTDDERYLGTVADILETGAHDVYIVKHNEGEYLIPAHKEIVTDIDREKNRITIRPLEGLLDL